MTDEMGYPLDGIGYVGEHGEYPRLTRVRAASEIEAREVARFLRESGEVVDVVTNGDWATVTMRDGTKRVVSLNDVGGEPVTPVEWVTRYAEMSGAGLDVEKFREGYVRGRNGQWIEVPVLGVVNDGDRPPGVNPLGSKIALFDGGDARPRLRPAFREIEDLEHRWSRREWSLVVIAVLGVAMMVLALLSQLAWAPVMFIVGGVAAGMAVGSLSGLSLIPDALFAEPVAVGGARDPEQEALDRLREMYATGVIDEGALERMTEDVLSGKQPSSEPFATETLS